MGFDDRRGRVERGLVPGPEARVSQVSDHLVLDRMEIYGVPGMSVAIIEDSKIDWVGCYGDKRGDATEPVTEDTLFQCCSTSKMVAALCALRLVDMGHLTLDGDVNGQLKDWHLLDSDGVGAFVTLRQLLSHTAGVNVHGAPGYPRGLHVPTLMQVLCGEEPAITAPVRVTSPVGRQWRYSAGGYCVVQHLIESITGAEFESVAQELVLEPLGMANSTFAQPLPEGLWLQAAAAHTTLDRVPVHGEWFVYPEQAVGGLWTTATDLAQVVIELQQALRGNGRVLSLEMAKQMLTVHTDNWNSGLGTYLNNPSEPFFSHTGAHLGWHAVLMGYANLGKGAVVLTNNGYTGSELYREFLLSAAAEYGWPGFTGSFRPDPSTPSATYKGGAPSIPVLKSGPALAGHKNRERREVRQQLRIAVSALWVLGFVAMTVYELRQGRSIGFGISEALLSAIVISGAPAFILYWIVNYVTE